MNAFATKAGLTRYARFHSWGSAREVFSWDDHNFSNLFCVQVREIWGTNIVVTLSRQLNCSHIKSTIKKYLIVQKMATVRKYWTVQNEGDA